MKRNPRVQEALDMVIHGGHTKQSAAQIMGVSYSNLCAAVNKHIAATNGECPLCGRSGFPAQRMLARLREQITDLQSSLPFGDKASKMAYSNVIVMLADEQARLAMSSRRD